MSEEIKKEVQDAELNPEELGKVSGGDGELALLLDWLKAHPDYANEAKRLLYSQGKMAAKTYVDQLIEEYQLPAEWSFMSYPVCAML